MSDRAAIEDVLADLMAGNPHTTGTVDTPIDRDEVVRYMGYPAGRRPTQRVARTLERWIPQAVAVAEPRATFLVVPVVSKTRRRLAVRSPKGKRTFEGAIGEFLAPAEYLALFIATAGAGIETLATKLSDAGRELPAMVVNAVGAERAEEAEAEMIRRLQDAVQPAGYATTLPYSPGYCGMKLTEQQTLFGLFEDIDTGVTLTRSCLMRPSKSVSGLVGIGPSDAVDVSETPCERCELQQCAMRR